MLRVCRPYSRRGLEPVPDCGVNCGTYADLRPPSEYGLTCGNTVGRVGLEPTTEGL
jgi:hypothetical protein